MTSWLLTPGPIYIRKFNRSKYDPLVEEATHLEGNGDYAYEGLSDGRETTVSSRHLAPKAEFSEENEGGKENETEEIIRDDGDTENNNEEVSLQEDEDTRLQEATPRTSERPLRSPAYLKDYISS